MPLSPPRLTVPRRRMAAGAAPFLPSLPTGLLAITTNPSLAGKVQTVL